MFNMWMFIMSSIMFINISDWITLWILMEMNIINFSIFLSKEKKKQDSSMKYFLIQSIAGSFLLLSFILNFHEKNIMNYNFTSVMLMFMVLLKTGSFPFNSWMIEISNKISWINFMFLNSIQKLIPLSLMWKSSHNFFMNCLILLNSLFSTLSCKMMNSGKKVLMISSFNTFSWIMMLSNSKMLSMLFLFLYSFMMIMFSTSMKKMNKNLNINNISLNMLINFITMSGIPPMIMFNLKWISYEYMLLNFYIMIPLFLMINSTAIMFMYMKLTYQSFFLEKNFSKKLQKTLLYTNLMSMNLIKN